MEIGGVAQCRKIFPVDVFDDSSLLGPVILLQPIRCLGAVWRKDFDGCVRTEERVDHMGEVGGERLHRADEVVGDESTPMIWLCGRQCMHATSAAASVNLPESYGEVVRTVYSISSKLFRVRRNCCVCSVSKMARFKLVSAYILGPFSPSWGTDNF